MALPAVKRRKITHDSDDDISDSDSGFSEAQVQSHNDIDDTANSDASMQEEDYDMGSVVDGEDEDLETGTNGIPNPRVSKETGHANTSRDGKKPHKRQAAELQDGAYTAEIYKSNVFKLQLDELLKQVKIKYGKKEAPAEQAMREIKEIIERLPSRGPLPIPEAEHTLKSEGIIVPFPSTCPSSDAKYKLHYERPASINATGSYALKIATRTDDSLGIDMVVTMPKTIFQDKDYLNYRYFYKRAFYLACLAAGLKKNKAHKLRLSFDCLNGNHLQPILLVEGSGEGDKNDFSASKCVIRIILAIPEGTFAGNKLRPTANCVRPKDSEGADSKPLPSTPFYNASVQSDATVTPYLKLIHKASSQCEGFKDACLLGRIWLRQRGLGSAVRKGGFGNFEWSAVMAVLLQPRSNATNPLLSPGYSSYQLFKATLQFIARQKSSKALLTSEAHEKKEGLDPLFYDEERNLNLFYKMTPMSLANLQLEARQTVDMLRDPVFDEFDAVFNLRTDQLSFRYDASIEVPLDAFGLDVTHEQYDDNLGKTCRDTNLILRRALNDRIQSIRFVMPEEACWKLSTKKPFEDQERRILIALETDPANAYRTVDHGPAAEDKIEAASFQQFWGEKSELRRFKDGSIMESVVWQVKNNGPSAIEQIVRHILGRHIGPKVLDAAIISHDLYSQTISSGRIQGLSGVGLFSSRMNALASLEKDIRDLEGMPLTVRHITAADSQLRYTATDVESTRMRMSIVIQFEGSTRWPDDLCAIQRTKIAFLLKLSELLAKEKRGYTSKVGLENSSEPSQNQGFLDIAMESGLIFRLRIHHDRELTLLERQVKDKTLDGQSREAAAAALSAYKRSYLHTPAHSQAFQTLCTRFPALSPSVRLTKRWFASHLLSTHFSPELIELFVARTFLHPSPWQVPSCATTGFLRTLFWISRWDWRYSPLIVDFSAGTAASEVVLADGTRTGGLKTADVENINTRFEAWRRIDPAMNRLVIFAVTNLDRDGTTWTDRGMPEKVVAGRMTALARAATEAIQTNDNNVLARLTDSKVVDRTTEPLAPSTLFAPQVGDFDLLVHISHKHVLSYTKKTSKFKNLALQESLDLASDPLATVPGISIPELFARDLQQIYGDAILWFWNVEDVSVIAGLWNPVVTARRGWKVRPGWNSVPVMGGKGIKKSRTGDEDDADAEIDLNKAAICHEIKRLGGELVKDVEVKGMMAG